MDGSGVAPMSAYQHSSPTAADGELSLSFGLDLFGRMETKAMSTLSVVCFQETAFLRFKISSTRTTPSRCDLCQRRPLVRRRRRGAGHTGRMTFSMPLRPCAPKLLLMSWLPLAARAGGPAELLPHSPMCRHSCLSSLPSCPAPRCRVSGPIWLSVSH